jgi:hypothetical protein
MESTASNCTLIWGQGAFRKTIPFDALTNTPIFFTSPKTLAYRAFATTFMALEAPFFQREHVIQVPGSCNLVGPPLSEKEFVAEENINYPLSPAHEGENSKEKKSGTQAAEGDSPSAHLLRRSALTFDPSPPLKEAKEYSLLAPEDKVELMRWHYRLGHVSFAKLCQLVQNNKIPKKLAAIRPLRCAGCLFGAMTKIPWRGKEQKSQHSVFIATKPGECASVDHLQLTGPGFYGQAKGRLTKMRNKNATIFVDHLSRLQYVYLMTSNLTSSETIDAKRAFESFAAKHGIKIAHYHCDNGCFADTTFVRLCKESRQKLTFCGVNTHFQNGIAERAICNLSESAQKQFLHAKQRWSHAASTALWPYALRSAAYLNNVLPMLEDGQSKLELFSGIQIGSSLKSMQTFGCPVFALQNALAAGHSIPRWNPRAWIGLNLGPSLMHTRNVHLVLSLTMGLVPPQFHCRFDDFFKTCKYGVSNAGTQSTRQYLAGFKHTTINPSLLMDERLLREPLLNENGAPQGSQLPPGDVSFSNSKTSNQNVFFEDIKVEFPPDATEQPSENARLPSQEARGKRIQAPKPAGLPIDKA